MAHPSGLASREGGSQAPAHREQHLPVSPVWEEALHPVQASGSMALERREGRVPAQQSRAEELPVGQVDERVLQIMGWLDAEPALSGAEAARRLGIPVRTGQRLRRAAEEQRQRRVTGQRRLRSVGDVGHGPAPQG
jgi:hypothetical protein